MIVKSIFVDFFGVRLIADKIIFCPRIWGFIEDLSMLKELIEVTTSLLDQVLENEGSKSSLESGKIP